MTPTKYQFIGRVIYIFHDISNDKQALFPNNSF